MRKKSNNEKNSGGGDDDAKLAALAREAAELSSRVAAARVAAAAAREEAVADAAADRVAAATDAGDLEGAAAALLRYERRVVVVRTLGGGGGAEDGRGKNGSCRASTAETLRGSLEQAIDSALQQGLGVAGSSAAAPSSSPSPPPLPAGCDGGIPAVASGVRSALSASALLSSSPPPSSASASCASSERTTERARAIGSSVLAEGLLLPLLRLGLEERVEVVEASAENGFWWRRRRREEASAAPAAAAPVSPSLLLLPEDAAAEAVKFLASAVLPAAGGGGIGSGRGEVRSHLASLVGAAAWPRASAAEVELRLSPAAADRGPGGDRAREAFAEIGSAALRLEAAAEAAGFAPPSSSSSPAAPSHSPSCSPSSNVTAAGGGRLAAFVAAVADRDLVGLRLEVVEAARALLVRGALLGGSRGEGEGGGGAGPSAAAAALSAPSPRRRRVGAPLPRRSPDADAWFALAAAARDRSGGGGGGGARAASSPPAAPPLLDWGPEGSDAPLLAEGEFAVSEAGDALAALVADAVARAAVLARGGGSGSCSGTGSGGKKARKDPAAAQALARGAADAAELAALLPPALSPRRRSLLLLLGPAALHRNDCRHFAGAITRALAAHAPALREGAPAAPGLLADAAHRLRAAGDAALAERVAAEAEGLALLFDGLGGGGGGGGREGGEAGAAPRVESPPAGSTRRMLASLAGRAAAAAVAAAAGRNSQRGDGASSAAAALPPPPPSSLPSSIRAAALPGGVFARLSADRDPARAAGTAAAAVAACLQGLARAGRSCRGTLPPRERAAVAASLLDACCSAAANRVLQLGDVPAADSEVIPALLRPLVEAGATASLGLDFSRSLSVQGGGEEEERMPPPPSPWPPRSGRRRGKRQLPQRARELNEGGEEGDCDGGGIESERGVEEAETDEEDDRVSAAVDASSPPEAELVEAVEASAPALAALKVSFSFCPLVWPFFLSPPPPPCLTHGDSTGGKNDLFHIR